MALLHLGLTVPLILVSERFENAAGTVPALTLGRLASTLFVDLLTGIGCALLLGALWIWRGAPRRIWQGALWGACGFLSLNFAPALGLPPELPGTAAAALGARQLWWLGTVAATALGLAVLCWLPGLWRKLPGVVLLAVPQLAGAPLAPLTGTLLPEALSRQFQWTALGVSAAFWLALGLSGAALYGRWFKAVDPSLAPGLR